MMTGLTVKSIGDSKTEVSVPGALLLISYSTPVAAMIGSRVYRTEEFHSRTTSDHINSWLLDYGNIDPDTVIRRPQEWFGALLQLGVPEEEVAAGNGIVPADKAQEIIDNLDTMISLYGDRTREDECSLAGERVAELYNKLDHPIGIIDPIMDFVDLADGRSIKVNQVYVQFQRTYITVLDQNGDEEEYFVDGDCF